MNKVKFSDQLAPKFYADSHKILDKECESTHFFFVKLCDHIDSNTIDILMHDVTIVYEKIGDVKTYLRKRKNDQTTEKGKYRHLYISF